MKIRWIWSEAMGEPTQIETFRTEKGCEEYIDKELESYCEGEEVQE